MRGSSGVHDPQMTMLHYPDPELADDVVALRPWALADVEAMVLACSDELTQRWTMVPADYGPQDARSFIEGADQRLDAGDGISLAVVSPSDSSEVLGSVGLVAVHPRHRRAEIGYWTSPHARGRGVAPQAVGLLSGWCLQELDLARIDLTPHVDNRSSQAVAERAGFRREGVLRDYYVDKSGVIDIVMFSRLRTDLP